MERIFIDANTWATEYPTGWTIFHKTYGVLIERVAREAVEEARDEVAEEVRNNATSSNA
jgi:hypothetical protein